MVTSQAKDLIFDVGLHSGEDTDFYLKKGFRVVGFEANPVLADQCRQRFTDAIASSRLTIIEGAIAPESYGEHVRFFQNPVSEWGTIETGWNERNKKLGFNAAEILVDRVDMVEAFRTHGIPFYLKIDIEGVDRHVLECLRPFRDRPKSISIESSKTDLAEITAELELMTELGYRKFKLVQQSTIPGSTVTARDLDNNKLTYMFEKYASGPFGEDLPGSWKSKDEALKAYQWIFRFYRAFGDGSVLRPLARRFNEFPGWYDTHAML